MGQRSVGTNKAVEKNTKEDGDEAEVNKEEDEEEKDEDEEEVDEDEEMPLFSFVDRYGVTKGGRVLVVLCVSISFCVFPAVFSNGLKKKEYAK